MQAERSRVAVGSCDVHRRWGRQERSASGAAANPGQECRAKGRSGTEARSLKLVYSGPSLSLSLFFFGKMKEWDHKLIFLWFSGN